MRKFQLLAFLLLLPPLCALAVLYSLGSDPTPILPGVTVGGTDVGGLSRTQAVERLRSQRDRYANTRLELRQEGRLLAAVRWREVGISPDFVAAAEAAWRVGREQSGWTACLRRGWRRLFPGETVELTMPVTIEADRWERALPAAPVDAAYDPKTGAIQPERSGIRVDLTALCQALGDSETGTVFRFPAELTPAEITAEELRQALFRDVLGEYATTVGGSAARRGNVALSAAAIDGTVVLPGAVFDYNAVVGERTVQRGYASAPAYVNGETVSEVGGGICQTSSTLYAAVLLSDLEIVTRTAHRYVSSYIPAGLDATVSWGGPEFRFRNDTRYPVKIQTRLTGDVLTVTILGTRLSTATVRLRSQVLSVTPYATRYEDTAALPEGVEQVRQPGIDGCTVQTYREVWDAGGTLLRSASEARSIYRSRDQVTLRGVSFS